MISRWAFHSRMVNQIILKIAVFSLFLILKRMEYSWKRGLESFSKKLI
jgi:hypothetical protein